MVPSIIKEQEFVETRIGKYLLKKKLGAGASGTVWLALDEFSGRDVALKVYETDDESRLSSASRAQFLTEASLAGRLQHPHIAMIIDAGSDEKMNFVVSEFVEGSSLLPFTGRASLLPLAEVVEIAFKCAGALDYAFRNDVIHRDIKPANILRAAGTGVKIADFGAAFVRNTDRTQILNIGSPHYVAPEQVRGLEPSYKSDMFSLGVVLYELLAGERPFAAERGDDILRRLMYENPEPLSRVRPDLPAALGEIVARALQKDPADRYGNWAEFALDLARAGRLSMYDKGVPDSEKFMALKACPMLADLDDAAIWEFVAIGTWSRLPSNRVVVRENEPGDSVFLLAAGEARVTLAGRLLNVLAAGEWFGEQPYVQGCSVPRQASMQTTADSVLVEFPRESLESLGDRSKQRFTLALLRALADRLSLSNVRISRMGAG